MTALLRKAATSVAGLGHRLAAFFGTLGLILLACNIALLAALCAVALLLAPPELHAGYGR